MEKILSVVLLCLVIAAPAVAAPATGVPAPSRTGDSNHWLYLGAKLGDSTVGALLGLQFTKIYSLEMRYDYIDNVYQPNTTIKSSSTSMAGVGMFPVKFSELDPFYVFAKAGYERVTVKSTTADPGIPGMFDPTTTTRTTVRKRVIVSAGAQYDFTRNFSGRIGKNFIGNDHSVYIAAIYKF